MKCQMCNKNDAVILIHQVINNKKKDMRLCEACAVKAGFIENKEKKIKFNLSNLIFSGLVFHEKHKESRLKKCCPGCGTTLKQILNEKKCGCGECYTVFRRELKRNIKKQLGVNLHKGKYPKRLKTYKTYLFDLRILKEKLKHAVLNEDYESAAVLRDKIKLLKNADW